MPGRVNMPGRALAAMRDYRPRQRTGLPPMPELTASVGPSVQIVKNALNGGEISPQLGGRFDQQIWQLGCHSLFNMIPLPWGGVCKRPGWRYLRDCGPGKAGAAGNAGAGAGAGNADEAGGACGRLLPFIFSSSESRLLEIFPISGTACGLRVMDSEGALICEPDLELPFTPAILAGLCYAQSADVIFVAHRDLPPGKLMRYADDDWRYETIRWLPEIEPPAWLAVGPQGPEPENEKRRVSLAYVCTAVAEESGEESIAGPVYHLEEQYPVTDSRYISLEIAPVEGALEYRLYKRQAGVFGFIGRISAPDEDGRYIFNDTNITPDTEDTPPQARDPFTDRESYPAVVFLHQQRLGYASSRARPLTIWLSQSGNFESMAASVPPQADDAIEASLAAPQANAVVWAMSDRSGLLMGTEAGEWLVCPGEGAALAPGDITFQPQSSCGSEPGLMPCRAASGLVFAQRGGRVVRGLGYSFQDDRYNAEDLSLLARHVLARRSIVAWCWQPEPCSILWMALSDGTMAGLTWLREQQVMAWHRHATRGRVRDLCSLPGASGDWSLFAIIEREGRHCLERLGPLLEQGQASGANHARAASAGLGENLASVANARGAGYANGASGQAANAASAGAENLVNAQAANVENTGAANAQAENLADRRTNASDGRVMTRNEGPFMASHDALANVAEGRGAAALATSQAYTDGPWLEAYEGLVSPCLPELSGQEGVSWLRRKKMNSLKARLIGQAPVMARLADQHGQRSESRLLAQAGPGLDPEQASDRFCALSGGWRDNPRLEPIFPEAAPVTLLGLAISMEVADCIG